jgi:hypothetical protein
MRVGPDLSNIGKRAPVEEENAPSTASPTPAGPTTQASPATKPATGASPSTPPLSAAPASFTAGASPATSAAKSAEGTTPAPASASPGTTAASPTPAVNAASAAAAAASSTPPPYTAAWHHRHLYSPRSVVLDSNMPAYHFLYEKRRISGERAADALKLEERDKVPEGWEVVPTYDAKCLVAYLMSLDQSHPLKEVRATAAPPTSSPAASSASPAPASTKEAK